MGLFFLKGEIDSSPLPHRAYTYGETLLIGIVLRRGHVAYQIDHTGTMKLFL